jgi:hypothetical protein
MVRSASTKMLTPDYSFKAFNRGAGVQALIQFFRGGYSSVVCLVASFAAHGYAMIIDRIIHFQHEPKAAQYIFQ